MSMPIQQAQNLVQGCIDQVRKVSPNMAEAQINASRQTIAALEEVRNRLLRLIAGGYKLERLHSTLLLCDETIRMQQKILGQQGDQKARLLQLAAGLNEVL